MPAGSGVSESQGGVTTLKGQEPTEKRVWGFGLDTDDSRQRGHARDAEDGGLQTRGLGPWRPLTSL